VKLLHLCPGFFVLEDFLDTQRDDVLSAGYRVALDKELGYIPLNKDMMVAATSNTPEFSSLSRAMPAPLANRWEDHSVDSPTVDEWNAWMAARYADRWDKRCYVFNKRFESDGYFLKVPDEPETTKNFPTPRTWTQLARNTYYSCSSPDALLGPEVGQKFRAFCDINVDIEELIADPAPWGKLDLDAKYMAGAMLASWFGKTPKEKLHESFNLIDTISDDSREYLVLVFQCTKVSALSRLFSQLFPYAKKYEKIAKQTLKDHTEVLT